MASDYLEIKTPEDLYQALSKAKKIEEAFEEVLHWQGFLTIGDPETGRILRALVVASSSHERLVNSLLTMISPHASSNHGQVAPPIVINGDTEVQFLQKLLEGEDLAYHMYSVILDALTHIDPQIIGGEKKVAHMREKLSRLVSEERRHREIVSELIAKTNP